MWDGYKIFYLTIFFQRVKQPVSSPHLLLARVSEAVLHPADLILPRLEVRIVFFSKIRDFNILGNFHNLQQQTPDSLGYFCLDVYLKVRKYFQSVHAKSLHGCEYG